MKPGKMQKKVSAMSKHPDKLISVAIYNSLIAGLQNRNPEGVIRRTVQNRPDTKRSGFYYMCILYMEKYYPIMVDPGGNFFISLKNKAY